MSGTKYLIGNWKMNGLKADQAYCQDLLKAAEGLADIEWGVCPPATLLSDFVRAFEGSAIKVGAQDCHDQAKGAYTGDVSPEMLKDIGVQYVILGHSERRRDHYETSSQVARKVAAALDEGLVPVVCVGEFLEKREAGNAIEYVANQLARSLPSRALKASDIMIAYEPVWAIGTGKAAASSDIEEMHAELRNALVTRFGDEGAGIKLLYGGSVSAEKADILSLANVDGALVGGASLTVDGFVGIAKGYLDQA